MNPSYTPQRLLRFPPLLFMIIHKFGQLRSDLAQHIINAFRNRVATQATQLLLVVRAVSPPPRSNGVRPEVALRFC
jgi:hypothetical protein